MQTVKPELQADVEIRDPLAVANTIAAQIGHKAFSMMGTTLKLGDSYSLVFNVRGCRLWNKIRVEHNIERGDTYSLRFMRVGKIRGIFGLKDQKYIEGIQADQLHHAIEINTGLRLSL